MPYIKFTDEQKYAANNTNIVDILIQQGEKVERSGAEWRWQRHDSVTIRGNKWYQHSRSRGGYAIDFVREFYNLTYQDAIIFLLEQNGNMLIRENESEVEKKVNEFKLPKKNSEMRRTYAYLVKERFIAPEVITYFVKKQKIYEEKKHHNIVFVGYDESGCPKHAHLKGTNSFSFKSFQGNVEGSDKRYSFGHVGKGNSIYVFEACIDMLSYITLNLDSDIWYENNYVVLDGVSEYALLHRLEQNKNITKVCLCLDHDSAGIEASMKISKMLSDKEVYILQSKYKDWNEDLKSSNGISVKPAQEHPQLIELEFICKRIHEYQNRLINKNDKNIDYDYYIIKYYNQFKDSKNISYLDAVATYSIAAAGYTGNLQPDEIIRKLYFPHENRKGWVVRRNNLYQSFNSIFNNSKNPDMYMSLALESIKAHIFITLFHKQELTKMPVMKFEQLEELCT